MTARFPTSSHDAFAARLIAWQRQHGRHDLPWQASDPYPIWVSEIMLQQTQVDTVIPYFHRFMARFPTVSALASAPEEAVLLAWSGLGYYARARHLHAAARRIMTDHGGCFPDSAAGLRDLPGIGRSTAAAIAAFAFGERTAILDGNVKRVLCRMFAIEGWPGTASVEKRLWALAEALLPEHAIAAYTQGLMDLGATVCTRARPRCSACPFADTCQARIQDRVAALPTPRPRREQPERTTYMLMIRHGRDFLLEKRPTPGIWGGLWSLPECPPEQDPERWLTARGLKPVTLIQRPSLSHAFTHFRLRILPILVEVEPLSVAPWPGSRWLDPEALADAALPTPVRRLLTELIR